MRNVLPFHRLHRSRPQGGGPQRRDFHPLWVEVMVVVLVVGVGAATFMYLLDWTGFKPGCDIKGDIAFRTGERIYRMPGDQYYDRTSVNLMKGERWFCSEDKAQAAGWRRSIR